MKLFLHTRTRHNDFLLKKPVNETTDGYEKTEDIEMPEVSEYTKMR